MMSRAQRRVARMLTTSQSASPPAELLRQLKADIPAELPALPHAADRGRAGSARWRRVAASLTVAAGLAVAVGLGWWWSTRAMAGPGEVLLSLEVAVPARVEAASPHEVAVGMTSAPAVDPDSLPAGVVEPPGDLVVVVRSGDAHPVAGATVDLERTDRATGRRVRVIANHDGIARMGTLPAGRYRLTVSSGAAGGTSSLTYLQVPVAGGTRTTVVMRVSLPRELRLAGRPGP